MKIALPNIENMVNPHFGTSRSFVIVDVQDNEIKNVEEISTVELAHQHEGLADLLVKKGASLVIVGGIGGGAIAGLEAYGLSVIKGASGEYRAVVQKYIEGTLENKNEVCNHHCEH